MKDPTKAVIGVSEHFYSLQGEGPEEGYPAVFLRTKGCTLDCVFCDTTAVWKTGKVMKIKELLNLFDTSGYIEHLRCGAILVLTGGSPLLHQDSLTLFLSALASAIAPAFLHVSVETEGVLMPSKEFSAFVSTWIVSPKLSSSLQPLKNRLKPEVLKWHAKSANVMTYFKYVIGSIDDFAEMANQTSEFKIRQSSVWLMPKASTREQLQGNWAAETLPTLCKANYYRYSNRLHVQLWDKTTGV